jgi:mannose-6-phosphate isomerase
VGQPSEPSAAGPREPLRFHPILKEKVWGGRRLEQVLGKRLPGPGPYGESWEIADFGEDRSRVAGGPWDGRDLHSLVAGHPDSLLGRAAASFPLLIKVIDACEPLSLQLHPGDEDQVAGRPTAKSEAWVILAAEPGARVACGLNEPGGRERFFDAMEAGDTVTAGELLRWQEVRAGDVVFLPAGTIHAIGAGILLLEVQQSSDVTYRIHDWGRAGLDGRPRPLHLKEARAVRARPEEVVCPCGSLSGSGRGLERIVDSKHFRIDGFRLGGVQSDLRATTRQAGRAGLLIVGGVEGRAEVRAPGGGTDLEIGPGEFTLVPAAAGEIEVRARGDFTGLFIREADRPAE